MISITDTVRQAVLAMPMAQTLKLQFNRVESGDVELQIPVQEAWCFRPGQLQATAVAAGVHQRGCRVVCGDRLIARGNASFRMV